MSVWNQAHGLVVAAKIEDICATYGAHCALGGSVMYRGHSDKDLDIVVYPHSANRYIKDLIVNALDLEGFKVRDMKPEKYSDKDLSVFDYDGRRIDVFWY